MAGECPRSPTNGAFPTASPGSWPGFGRGTPLVEFLLARETRLCSEEVPLVQFCSVTAARMREPRQVLSGSSGNSFEMDPQVQGEKAESEKDTFQQGKHGEHTSLSLGVLKRKAKARGPGTPEKRRERVDSTCVQKVVRDPGDRKQVEVQEKKPSPEKVCGSLQLSSAPRAAWASW